MPVSEILFPSSWTKTCLSQPEGFKVRQPRGFPTVINLRKSWLVTPPQPEGLKVRQPRATPWVYPERHSQPVRLLEKLFGSTDEISVDCCFLQPYRLQIHLQLFPRALPWAVSP